MEAFRIQSWIKGIRPQFREPFTGIAKDFDGAEFPGILKDKIDCIREMKTGVIESPGGMAGRHGNEIAAHAEMDQHVPIVQCEMKILAMA